VATFQQFATKTRRLKVSQSLSIATEQLR